ncbi:hypothetical protein JCM16138_16030 [Thermococcus atlanticus]
MEDASGRRLYVCMRCGNKFWSRAKKPQCSVCRSKRVVPYEEFLKLPQEEQERILGKRREAKKEEPAKEVTAEVEKSGNEVKREEGERVNPVENREVEVKREESRKVSHAHQGDKPGEKVKGERVKSLKVPLPRLSWKAYAIIGGLAFAYYLYKVGWFDEMWRQLRNLGAVKDLPDDEQANPFLERARRNIAGGR